MVLVKVLKRKDAASVVVAVVLGLIIYQFLSTITSPVAAEISGGVVDSASVAWRAEDFYPVVWVALQLIAFEILAWLYVGLASVTKRR